MNNFCESLRKNTTNMINFEQKKITPLTNKQHKLYEITKTCYISKNNSNINKLMIKIIKNLKIIVLI